MKKIFTLLCAMLVVLSASAVDLKKLQTSGLTPSKVTSVEKQKAMPNKAARVATSAKFVPQFTTPTLSKAKKAEADVINVDLTGVEPVFEWYPESSDWYFGCADVEGNYVVRLDYITTEDGKYGHYTLSDLDPNYSYIADYINQVYVHYEDADFTFAETANGGYTLDATLKGDDGYTYKVTGTFTASEPKTIDFKATAVAGAYYYASDGDWYLTINSDDAQYAMHLDIVTGDQDVFAGEWTDDDMLLDYCNFSANGGSAVSLTNINIVTTSVEGCTPKEACTIKGTAKTPNGDVINIDVVVKAPLVPTATVDLGELETLEAEWPSTQLSGSVFILGSEESLDLWQIAVKGVTGEFNKDNMYLDYTGMVSLSPVSAITVDHGTVTLTFDTETMTVKGEADLVMDNAIEYTFTFSYKPEVDPTPNNQVYTNLNWDDSWGALGIYFFDAENENTALDGYVYGDEIGNIAVTEVAEDGTMTAINPITVLEAEVDADAPSVKASYLGENMTIVNVDAKFVIPAVEDEYTVYVNVGEINNLIEDMGAWQFNGYSADETNYASIAIYADQLEGTYDLQECMGDLKGYNYVVFDADKEVYELAKIYKGNITVAKTGENLAGYPIYTLAGDVQAGTHLVHLTMVGADAPKAPQGDEYDMQDEDVTATFDIEEDAQTYEFSEEDGYIFGRWINEDNEMFSTLIYTTSVMLEAGDYPINDEYTPGTVQAGALSGSSVYPTFYGTLTEDGYINVPLFLCVDGTLTVSYDEEGYPSYVVNATNTWGRTANIQVLAPVATGINKATVKDASVKKYLKNSNVVIEKNGVKFNAIGQQVK